MDNAKVKTTIASIIKKMIENEVEGWPPTCGMILYQPKRPTIHKNLRQRLKTK